MALNLRTALKAQGRFDYYQRIMAPLPPDLFAMGARGLPVDLSRMAWHRKATQRLVRMASRILRDVGQPVLDRLVRETQNEVDYLEKMRREEHAAAGKRVAFSQSKQLTGKRGKLARRIENAAKGLNFDSHQQAIYLFYDWYGLPVVNNRKTGQPTTDEDAVNSLIKRLTRVDEFGKPAPTIRPKRGIPKEEVIRVLRAKAAGKKWATWERNFLSRMGDLE